MVMIQRRMRGSRNIRQMFKRLWILTLIAFVWLIMSHLNTIQWFKLSSSNLSKRDYNLQRHWENQSYDFNANQKILHGANHLIIVAGHSVTISGHLQDADRDEQDWFLLDYQKGKGLPESIVAHIREGIRQTAMDEHALLIFSGGETRAQTGPLNEGTSYFHVADVMNLWEVEPVAINHDTSMTYHAMKTVRSRTMSEEFATDSFQNLLFSICRFHEIVGTYPEKITLISFTFKQHRFETMHSQAIRWPRDKFQFIGVDPPASTGFDLSSASLGEMQNAVKPFESDPYGCNTPILREKRKLRNPFNRTPPYELSCPDMKAILNWCGPDLIPTNLLPWLT